MSDPTQQMLEFITHLPPSVNPYEATANKLRQLGQIAKPILWGRILRRIIIFLFLLSCCEAIVVLWLRKKANKLKFFRLNKLGLIHIEAMNEVVVLLLVFSFLSALDLATQEFVEKGLLHLSTKLLLRTSKFQIAADGCWLFLWICAIEVVMSSTFKKMQARSGLSIKLPLHTRLIANSLLILVLIAPGAALASIFIPGSFNLRKLERILEDTIKALLRAAPTYQPDKFNILSLLQILAPAKELAPTTRAFANDIRASFILYLGQRFLIAVLYMPTSLLAFRGLRLQTLPQNSSNKSQTEGPVSNDFLKGLGRSIFAQTKTPQDQVKQRLRIHALLIYIDTVLYVVLLTYLLIYKGSGFVNDPKWVLVEQVLGHGPTAIIGNVILACLIQNAIYTSKQTQLHRPHERLASEYTTGRSTIGEK